MADNLNQAAKNRADMAEIQSKYITGEISRDEAKRLTQPVIDRINKATIIKTKELNKKYNLNRNPGLINFISAMRNRY